MADSDVPHVPAAWATMDADSNGKLSRAEVENTLWAQQFDAMDTDHDGQVTEKEYIAFMQSRDNN
ncbi:EF-hand domain-containing protein [Salinisphaera sp. Q1T1-3]|uniref:EF-hand domain-containing protein n=1 Tax=Salinisphaera sp. Q1T1-3 TaxID=2321229 RepID=UPI001314AB2D|nr:EF-hand domain-containing protein [Salinisphaera sp. Q1T1-3]